MVSNSDDKSPMLQLVDVTSLLEVVIVCILLVMPKLYFERMKY